MTDTVVSTELNDEYGSRKAFNGWVAIAIMTIILAAGTFSLSMKLYPVTIMAYVSFFIGVFGLFQLNPRIVAVGTFFGKSTGNYTGEGLLFINPFYSIVKVSTKSDITRTPLSKINDLSGNPIMAAMQGEWYVNRPASSVFNIDKPVNDYVADVFLYTIRHVVSEYAYDGLNDDPSDSGSEDHDNVPATKNVYLRTSSDVISERLKALAQERLKIAGVKVVSANLIDLAYAPEIASAMLQVQQANAFLNARRKIVKGATGVALQAISDIQSDSTNEGLEIKFDKREQAMLVSNLLIILCGDTGAQPVLSLGDHSA